MQDSVVWRTVQQIRLAARFVKLQLTELFDLKTFSQPAMFHKSYPPPHSFTSSFQTASTHEVHGLLPGPFLLSCSVFVFSFSLSWPSRHLSSARESAVSYRILWLLTFWPQITGFPGLITEYFYMSSLVILATLLFEISCGKTDRQTQVKTIFATAVPSGGSND